jgi:hypothetical protein
MYVNITFHFSLNKKKLKSLFLIEPKIHPFTIPETKVVFTKQREGEQVHGQLPVRGHEALSKGRCHLPTGDPRIKGL